MKTNFESFKEMIVDAKNGNIEAGIGILFVAIASPLFLVYHIASLVGRGIAFIICFVMELFGSKSWYPIYNNVLETKNEK